MKCEKCGADLHPEQKVCIECGQRTIAGGGFIVEEEKQWRPTRNMIVVTAGVVVILIVLLIANGMRTPPPEVAAKQWFDAMAQRQTGVAGKSITDHFRQTMVVGISDLPALSDSYFDAISVNNATYTVSKPVLDVPDNPTTARVTINIKFPDGRSTTPVQIELVKSGRRWLIDKANQE